MDGFAPNHGGRPLKIYTLKFGSVSEERLGCEVDASRDRAAKVFTAFGQRVEGGGCTEVNDAGRAAIKIHHRHRVADTIRADGSWIFVTDPDSGLDASIHDKRFLL